jgi:hypothetical protein
MKHTPLTRRHFVGGSVLALGTATLPACGGGEAQAEATADTAADARLAAQGGVARSVTTPPADASAQSSKTGAGTTPPGPVFTTLKLSATQTGVFGYSATVLPLPGQVPAGSGLLSPDDLTLRGSVLSRWSDGSAAVIVASGTATVITPGEFSVQVQAGNGPANEGPLDANRIVKIVESVQIALGSLGTINVTDFGTPERIWWANPQSVCARYRAAAPGHATLEAVIDIQTFGSRALVEVVLENCKVAASNPVKPAAASYTTAVVSINGRPAASISNSAAPGGSHAAFRSVYARGWVGGDPGLRAAQAVADLQKHPLLFKCDQNGSVDMAGYTADAYVPWGAGRQRGAGMGGGGDHASIGPLPQWEAHYLQSGDMRAAGAVEASALAVLGFNINYRNVATGRVPTFAEIGTRGQSGAPQLWPSEVGDGNTLTWETAHSPAVGLMAFAVRPSPVYIELAQKVAVWNGTWSGNATPNWTSGTLGYWYQIRGRAWGMRSLAHAAFLTPDADAWRASCLVAISNSAAYLDGWRTDSKSTLGGVWDAAPSSLADHASNSPHFQVAMWQHHYLVTEYHKVASAKLLPADQQAALTTLTDWLAMQPVRWVTERPDGGWRYVPYSTAIGPSKTAISSPATWNAEMAMFMTDAPSGVAGPWRTFYNNVASSYAGFVDENVAGAAYVSYFWSALVAAVERGLPGAAAAWQTVQANVTNLNSWRAGFAADPRWGSAPRSGLSIVAAPPPVGLGNGSDLGSVVGNLWTPGRDASGVVNASSWATVPPGRWIDVAGTRMDGLDAVVKAAVPGWQDRGTGKWVGVTHAWNGVAIDEAGGRAWWICSGGHNDSSNNGIYRFDALKMNYAVEKMPSDTTRWSASYNNGFTQCLESVAAFNADKAAGRWSPINGWYFDELYWDRTPTSRHTYSGVTFLPDTNELVMCVRRLWRYSLASGQWTYKRTPGDTDSGALGGMGEENILHYDQSAKQLLISTCGSNGPWGNTYDLGSAQWTAARPPGTGWDFNGAADTRFGDVVTLFMQPEDPGSAAYPSPGKYLSYNITTRAQLATGSVQFAGGLAQSQFAAGFDGCGMVYVPPLNRYWTVAALKTGALVWLELDPTTAPWTLRPLTQTGAVPVLSNNCPYVRRRMMWVPSMNAVLFLGSADKNITLYKV